MTSNTTATLTFTRDLEGAWAYPAVPISPGADAGVELPRRAAEEEVAPTAWLARTRPMATAGSGHPSGGQNPHELLGGPRAKIENLPVVIVQRNSRFPVPSHRVHTLECNMQETTTNPTTEYVGKGHPVHPRSARFANGKSADAQMLARTLDEVTDPENTPEYLHEHRARLARSYDVQCTFALRPDLLPETREYLSNLVWVNRADRPVIATNPAVPIGALRQMARRESMDGALTAVAAHPNSDVEVLTRIARMRVGA